MKAKKKARAIPEPTPTPRGFLRADFSDANSDACSIQESSIATADLIWLGQNRGTHDPVTGSCMARMHLTREHAAALIPLLRRFVKTGRLAMKAKGR